MYPFYNVAMRNCARIDVASLTGCIRVYGSDLGALGFSMLFWLLAFVGPALRFCRTPKLLLFIASG